VKGEGQGRACHNDPATKFNSIQFNSILYSHYIRYLHKFLNGELYHNHHCNILRFQSSHSSDSNFMLKHKGPVLPDHLFCLFLQCYNVGIQAAGDIS